MRASTFLAPRAASAASEDMAPPTPEGERAPTPRHARPARACSRDSIGGQHRRAVGEFAAFAADRSSRWPSIRATGAYYRLQNPRDERVARGWEGCGWKSVGVNGGVLDPRGARARARPSDAIARLGTRASPSVPPGCCTATAIRRAGHAQSLNRSSARQPQFWRPPLHARVRTREARPRTTLCTRRDTSARAALVARETDAPRRHLRRRRAGPLVEDPALAAWNTSRDARASAARRTRGGRRSLHARDAVRRARPTPTSRPCARCSPPTSGSAAASRTASSTRATPSTAFRKASGATPRSDSLGQPKAARARRVPRCCTLSPGSPRRRESNESSGGFPWGTPVIDVPRTCVS